MITKYNMTENNFTKKLNNDGSINPKYVDLLDEDRPVAGQKFVCISFLSPEKILKNKNEFFFKEFLKQWELTKSMEKYTQFLDFIAYKYNLSFENLSTDLEDFLKQERNNLFSNTTLNDEYKNFVDANEKRLEDTFNEQNSFQTSVRGLKVRGSYPSQGEAELRCQMLRELDPNHDVFVGPVGVWMPWHPEAYKTGRVEYLEEELNNLMNNKQKNEDAAKVAFEQRVKENKAKAIEDNMQKARESGNVLTQTLDENGELINVKDMNTQIKSLENNNENSENTILTADIRKELFEKDVVLDKNSDHGVSEILSNQSNMVEAAAKTNSEDSDENN